MKTRPSQTAQLKKPIILSAIIHAIMILALSATPSVYLPSQERPIKISMLWVELPRGTSDEIGLGIRKAKGLPKSTIEEQRRLFEPEEPSQEPLPPKMKGPVAETKEKPETKRPEIKTPPETKRRTPTDQRIRDALAKIDRQLKKREIVPEAAQIDESGEGYKYGTGTDPLRVAPSDPEYLKYQAMVRAKVMHEWVIPARYTEEGSGSYNATLEVLINMDGDVVSIRWMSPSGDATFDQSAVRAIKSASPFPKPPDRLAWEAYNEGFLVEFDTRLKPRY